MTSSRSPDFFIVGHPKTGTTALFHALRRHPQIFMPEMKEPMFLSPDIVRYGTTLEEYHALFGPARPGQLAGEASVWYLASREAARRIFDLNPKAKIIALFREPVEFVRSLHLELRLHHVEPERDLRGALELESTRCAALQGPGCHVRTQGDEMRKLIYSDHVRYVAQLQRYHALFPRRNVMAIIYDDFQRDNAGVTRSVLRFLGVDDTVGIELERPNRSARVRSLPIHKVVRQAQMGTGASGQLLKTCVKAMTTRRGRERMRWASDQLLLGRPEALDPELRRALMVRFGPEVRAFSRYVERDLVELWNYGRIAEGREPDGVSGVGDLTLTPTR